MVRKLLCFVGAAIMLLAMPLAVGAEAEDPEPYIRRMIGYYRYYQEGAQVQIDTLLDHIRSLDVEKGILWERIMENWSWVNSEMEVQEEILPDGLPEDDSLCIVVLGYGLNADGSMQRELVERLQVGLASAEKYPNAYVLCTGGETAANAPGVSEAGQMGQWLLKNGLDRERLILETDSQNTAQNALNSFEILEREYPQVSSIAVVTSDYHIRWGCAMFTTASIWGQSEGGSGYTLVGNAVCDTALDGYDSMYYQAWGISYITGIGLDNSGKPVLE